MNEELLKRLDFLADKLGTTAAHLWQVLLKQARIEIAVTAIIIAVALTAALVLRAWWFSVLRRYRIEKDIIQAMTGGEFLAFVFANAATAFVVAFAIASLFQLPTLILNPEYWALKEIVCGAK